MNLNYIMNPGGAVLFTIQRFLMVVGKVADIKRDSLSWPEMHRLYNSMTHQANSIFYYCVSSSNLILCTSLYISHSSSHSRIVSLLYDERRMLPIQNHQRQNPLEFYVL